MLGRPAEEKRLACCKEEGKRLGSSISLPLWFLARVKGTEDLSFFTLSIAPASISALRSRSLHHLPLLFDVYSPLGRLMTFGPLISIFSITLRSSAFSQVHAKNPPLEYTRAIITRRVYINRIDFRSDLI